jgi:hypothetical protein
MGKAKNGGRKDFHGAKPKSRWRILEGSGKSGSST